MKILNLSLDNSILNKNSSLATRVIEYGNLVEKYIVIVPSLIIEEINLTEKIKIYGSGGKNKIIQIIKLFYKASKIIKKERVDVITVQDQYYLALIAWLLAKKFQLGLELQIHGFEKYHGLRRLVARFIIKRADAIRAVSRRMKKFLIGEFGAEEEKITVAPIFFEIKNVKIKNQNDNEKSKIKNSENSKFIFLTIGRLVPVKNIGLQIEAMTEIIKQYSNIELWIVGDGPEFNNLKFKIINLKLEKNIVMFGWKDNLEKYYNGADAFLLTSDQEGWGLAVIEAASFGLPIIMTDVGCAGEVIRDQESGLVIPIGDKNSLINAMKQLIQNESLRTKYGKMSKMAIQRLPNKEETLALYKQSWEKAKKV
jgi:glycosyltransferase involved in cell wall biosynthesis